VHGCVVGPGSVTPQRTIMAEGSPYAVVPWLEVSRCAIPLTSAGMASITGAQSGLAPSGAPSTATADPHPVSTSALVRAAPPAARRRRAREDDAAHSAMRDTPPRRPAVDGCGAPSETVGAADGTVCGGGMSMAPG